MTFNGTGGGGAAKRMAQDAGSIMITEEGATAAQLGRLFRMKPETVRAKIIGNRVRAVGQRFGFDIYHVHEVAPFLVKPAGGLEEAIKRMSHHDLPPLLTKEFWNGLSARAKYQTEAGELWHTKDVVAGFSEIQKVMRMFLLTLPDHLTRQANLNPAQRRHVQQLTDGCLESIREVLRQLFPKSDAADPHAASEGDQAEPADGQPPGGTDDPAWDL